MHWDFDMYYLSVQRALLTRPVFAHIFALTFTTVHCWVVQVKISQQNVPVKQTKQAKVPDPLMHNGGT